jgi:hypothetical protein
VSSGSHAKVLLFDENEGSVWHSVIGSCNFLSSEFDWLEMSLHTRSNRIALQLFGRLMAAQLPPSGVWPTVGRRLESKWQNVRKLIAKPEEGPHRLELLLDRDHYACVTRARDQAQNQIDIGCDLFGLAAETSVLVPLTRAAELERKVNLRYCRPSKSLAEEGRGPDVATLKARGIMVDLVPQLHGKYLLWDNEALAFTSFNWLSTVVDGTRVRGAEIGILACGPNLRSMFENKQPVLPRGLVGNQAK